MSAYLPLLANGTGGALTGHSTAAHRSLRSLPPALQPGSKETIKTEGLSGWSTTTKDALSRAQYVMKEMEDMEVTLRPEERGIFEHLPPECQKSRKYAMDDDLCGNSGLVKTGVCACASTRGLTFLYSTFAASSSGSVKMCSFKERLRTRQEVLK